MDLGAWGFAAAHEYIMRNFDSDSKVCVCYNVANRKCGIRHLQDI